MRSPPLRCAPFPYTTLFRSRGGCIRIAVADLQHPGGDRIEIELRQVAAGSESDVVGNRARAEHHGAGAGTNRARRQTDRKSTRLNSSHLGISYAVFCLKKKI